MPFATPQRARTSSAPAISCAASRSARAVRARAAGTKASASCSRKNPRYWDPARAHLDAIVLLENIPRDTQFLMFERGELDTAEQLAAPDYLWSSTQPAWQPYVHRADAMNAYGSRMNVRVKPFDDRRVRQALNYALDKAHTRQAAQRRRGARRTASCRPACSAATTRSRPTRTIRRRRARCSPRPAIRDGLRRRVRDDQRRGGRDGSRRRCRRDLAEVGVRVQITLMSFATLGDRDRRAPTARRSR